MEKALSALSRTNALGWHDELNKLAKEERLQYSVLHSINQPLGY